MWTYRSHRRRERMERNEERRNDLRVFKTRADQELMDLLETNAKRIQWNIDGPKSKAPRRLIRLFD